MHNIQSYDDFRLLESAKVLTGLQISIDGANDPQAKTVYFNADGSVHESVDMDFSEAERGGVIVFSTDVNSVKMSDNKLVNWVKQHLTTFWNRHSVVRRIGDLVKRFNEVYGITIGGFVKGRYFDRVNNKTFDETSTSVEVVGIAKEVLLRVAEAIAKEFQQQTVLVKCYTDNSIMLVKP